MKKTTAHITINNKKHEYSIEKKNNNVVFVTCKDANIAQDFLKEDVADLIIDLPNLIIAEKEYRKNQSEVIRFRIAPNDKKKIEKRAIKEGFTSLSDYLRHLALN